MIDIIIAAALSCSGGIDPGQLASVPAHKPGGLQFVAALQSSHVAPEDVSTLFWAKCSPPQRVKPCSTSREGHWHSEGRYRF
jgi:hypothetical protein